MIKKPIVAVALAAMAILASSFADAQYYEPADGQYYSTPSQYQYQPALVPQYHFNPHSRLDVLENALIMNQMATTAAIVNQRRASMTPEQIQAEQEYRERYNCSMNRFWLGYATLGLYGVYSLMFNKPCEDVIAQPRLQMVSAKSATTEPLPEADRQGESADIADLKKKAKTLDDLSMFIRSTGVTQEEFISWLEAMRFSHQDPAKAAAIVKSILESPR